MSEYHDYYQNDVDSMSTRHKFRFDYLFLHPGLGIAEPKEKVADDANIKFELKILSLFFKSQQTNNFSAALKEL